MAVFSIHEAKTHFFKLLERVLSGEEVIITKAGKPVARILPVTSKVAVPQPGNDKGKVIIMPDFDDPLEEFKEKGFYSANCKLLTGYRISCPSSPNGSKTTSRSGRFVTCFM